MAKKIKPPSLNEVLDALRTRGFDVEQRPVVANTAAGFLVSKHGCAAVLIASLPEAFALAANPGFVLQGEISRLLDRGYQKFLKTSTLEVPATADHLRAVHQFTEELKEIIGAASLYNQSLGTVSDQYLYDRVKGRDLPETERATPAWQLPSTIK